jgi:methylmalonyl-CoA mutase
MLNRLSRRTFNISSFLKRPLTYDPRWTKLVQKEIGNNQGPESLEKLTPEGIVLKPVYSPKDVTIPEEYPGIFPYTRGPYASMYTQKPWTVRQYAGFSTAEESNAFYKKVNFAYHCRINCIFITFSLIF